MMVPSRAGEVGHVRGGGGGTCMMIPCLTSRRGVFDGGGTCIMVPCLTSRRGVFGEV